VGHDPTDRNFSRMADALQCSRSRPSHQSGLMSPKTVTTGGAMAESALPAGALVNGPTATAVGGPKIDLAQGLQLERHHR